RRPPADAQRRGGVLQPGAAIAFERGAEGGPAGVFVYLVESWWRTKSPAGAGSQAIVSGAVRIEGKSPASRLLRIRRAPDRIACKQAPTYGRAAGSRVGACLQAINRNAPAPPYPILDRGCS